MKSCFALLLVLTLTQLPQMVHASYPVQNQAADSLQIISATPKGQTETRDQSRMIVVIFNKPMVPLQELPQFEEKGPLTFEPQLSGKYRWLGTSTLTFVPSDTLPFATEYRVKVPAGVKALDGSILKSGYEWTFQTPRPVLVRTIPEEPRGEYTSPWKWVELNQLIYLQFNQPIDPSRATRFVSLKENSQPINFSLRYPKPEEMTKNQWDFSPEYVLVIEPTSPFHKSATINVDLKAGLPSSIGPLGMVNDASFYFTTYNEFNFNGMDNTDHHRPDEHIRLIFSNPVWLRDLAKHIDFQPHVEIPPEYAQNEYHKSDGLYLSLPLLPDTQYVVKIDKSLKDIFGNELGKDVTFTFTTGDFSPYVSMVTGQGLLEAYGPKTCQLVARNMDSVQLRMASITENDVIPLLSHDDLFNDNVDPSYVQSNIDKIWQLHLRRNKLTRLPVHLDEAMNNQKTGFVFAAINTLNPRKDSREYYKAFFQVTELCITAKFSADNNLVWVTHSKDATPVDGAEVQVRGDDNKILWTGKTDSQGLVETPGWGELNIPQKQWGGQPQVWIFARHGDDVAFTRTEEGTGIEPYRFNIDYNWRPQYQPWSGSIFTDRGLYRAGESVFIKGIVRRRVKDDWQIPKYKRVLARVMDSQNEVVLQDTVLLSPYGAFTDSLNLKPTAHLGDYRIEALVPSTAREEDENEYEEGGQSPKVEGYAVFASGEFSVEAFRPAEFEVTNRFLQDSYIVGDTCHGTINARYLFGAPMRNEKVEWRLRSMPSYFQPPDHEEYSFGSDSWLWSEENYSNESQLLASNDTTLDNEGSLSVSVPLPVGTLVGTKSLMLEADVTSPSRRVVSGRTGAVVHGGEYYIGIKRSSTFLTTQDTLRYSLITVHPNGKIFAGQNLDVKLIKREWISVRKAGADERWYWETEKTDSTIVENKITTADSAGENLFLPKAAGLYFITADGHDTRGNEIQASAYFYVAGSGYVAWERSDDDRIEIVSDAKSYKPESVARLIVKSPYEKAIALISMERDGIIREWTTELVGSAPEVDIPLGKDCLPNVFVSVVLLQGRLSNIQPTESDDIGKPSFKIGYINLPVDPGTNHLSVNVASNRPTYHPGDSVTATVVVKNASGAGEKSDVTISVADVGVLNLIGYELPDPFELFFGPRPLGVSTSEMISHLVEQRSYGEKGEDVGGGGAAFASVEMRGDFRLTAYWNPSIETDDSGRVTVRFKLPDNLTQFKIMAVAQTKESEFGRGSSTFRVNKDFLLQAALPRFARFGDSFEAGVVATNYTETPGHVSLRATATGEVKRGGKEVVDFDLKPGESKEIRFSYTAIGIGSAQFNFQGVMKKIDSTMASGGPDSLSMTDGITLKLPVEVPRMKESVALYESTTDSANQALIVPRDIYANLGELELTTASTALGGLEGSVDYLFQYPYGCLEQQMSRILPIILGKDMVDAFHLPILKGRDAHAVAQKGLDEIGEYQTGNGGLSIWKGDRWDYPCVTAYTLYVMAEAKAHGYRIDQEVANKVIEYCKNFLHATFNQSSPYDIHAWYGVKSMMLYALALHAQAEPAYMQQLFLLRDELPIFARALLLKAIHASTKNDPMESELVRNLMNQMKITSTTAHFEEPDWEGLEWIYSTNTRTTAIILQALLEVGSRDPVLSKVVRWIMQEQRVGRWRSTQENVYVVDALSTYFRAFESETPYFKATISVAGKQILQQMFEGRNLNTNTSTHSLASFKPGEQLPVSVKKLGAGILYYGVRMNYYPVKDSIPRDEGIALLKTITPLRGSIKGDGGYDAGSSFKVTLTVVTPQERNFVVVDDPLPAGFEAVNLNFETESSELGRQLGEEQSSEDEYWWGGFNHVEQKDDRVLLFADALFAGVHTYSYIVRATTYGTFSMPATYAEQMYAPDVFGRTTSKTIVVK
ncbi:MAG TPA: Ig-like domain-containing protein [Candidatus Acidoferrales bacterium]|nr:Ig-like domain-containing protein [Candidatus Acidoferrales bacterium]